MDNPNIILLLLTMAYILFYPSNMTFDWVLCNLVKSTNTAMSAGLKM